MSEAKRRKPPTDDGPQILSFPRADDNLTLSQVVAAYLDYKRSEVRAGTFTQEAYARSDYYLSSFIAFLGGTTPTAKLCNADMKRWLLAHPEWPSSNTKSDATGCLCACFHWAADDAEIVSRAPFKRVKGLFPPPEPQLPTEPEELKKVLDAARHCDGKHQRKRPSRSAFRVALFFLWDSGSRPKEMRVARIEWINWTERVLVIPGPATKTYRKTGKDRMIPLSAKLYRLLRWICRGRKDGPIFLSGRKRPWKCRSFAAQWRNYARMSGVREEAKASTCRHGFCVQALESGDLTAKEVADIMGHTTSRQVERVYGASTRFRAGRLRESRDKMDRRKHGPENTST